MAQGFLHANGKYLYDGNNNEIILRGIGTGNWMLQEGYMMQTSDVAGTQHEFRNKLIETIGQEKTDSFYNAWLAYHFTRTDVDSMKSWGFNSIRVAMHYKWFTLPIEEEPFQSQNTWLDKGFQMIDSLLDWCSDNEMYLILDLHGAPGGQGKDANISDYDPSKPSLWDNLNNRNKTVALWKKLAERYKDEPWIGGYDLINETNWTFTQSNNTPLWDLFKKITTAIREVDTNHLIILEGNSFANDYTGLPALWDDNMMLSFHKYWTYNNPSALDFIISLRNSRNVPIWLGESGENSNTWFTSLISLCESQHIGWSWWPVKKPGINNPLRVKVNPEYTNLVNYWKGQTSAPTVNASFEAVLEFAENHKIQNCVFQKDVVDAMIRQPNSFETKAYVPHVIGEAIYATDYDLGRCNFAYFDTDTANFHLSQNGTYTEWNKGWIYRNDGVDIETCSDTETNGYDVGWTADGEWLLYTLKTDSTAGYTLNIRYAAGGTGAVIRFESDNIPITENISLTGTGGWQKWATKQVSNVILSKGIPKVKLVFVKGGANLNYIKFSNPVSVNGISFKHISSESSEDGKSILLYLNKNITTSPNDILKEDFTIQRGGQILEIDSFVVENQVLKIYLKDELNYGDVITLSYNGSSVSCASGTLDAINALQVKNNLPVRYNIPGKIQAENFHLNHGFELEACEDTDAGYNTSYANAGDYLDYLVNVTAAGRYFLNYRVATIRTNAEIIIITDDGQQKSIDTVKINSTGGWQIWKTQISAAELPAGRYTIRIYAKQGEFNLNWFEITSFSAIEDKNQSSGMKVFPVPAKDVLVIESDENPGKEFQIDLFNMQGVFLQRYTSRLDDKLSLDVSWLAPGIYSIVISGKEIEPSHHRFIISG